METITQVKERPILFSGPMIRAILAGTKSQTRRIMKPQPVADARWGGGYAWKTKRQSISVDSLNDSSFCPDMYPYGRPGDRLWVRESWGIVPGHPERKDDMVVYRANGASHSSVERWRPSIHMPRWASRLTLEITDVRVERLQEISAGDCLREGIRLDHSPLWDKLPPSETDDYNAYRDLWERINGPGSWERNDFVWVISFKRVEGTDHA